MSGDSSEEKALPPSQKKIQDARKKGQIAKSSDAVAAASVTMLTLYIAMAWGSIQENFARMFDVAGRAAARGGEASWRGAINETADAAADIIVPLYVIGLFATVLGAVISNKGVIFSFHPLKPDLKRIHPSEGFKKIFSIRNFIEFFKAFIKSMLLLGALSISAWYGISAVLRIPYCGADCTGEVLVTVAAPLVIIALLLFVFGALIDTGLQKWLFTRELRMTHSEVKRENKEMYGDPQIRGARKEQHRDAASGESGKASGILKSRAPTLVICAGNDVAIAIRYVPGETAAPVVVGKGTGQRAGMIVQSALDARIRVENDPILAKDLLRRAKMESFIPESMFRAVARVLNR